MLSERVARRIERLLEQADYAVEERSWPIARDCVQAVLALDPENGDARAYLGAAERALDVGSQGAVAAPENGPAARGLPALSAPAQPTAFADGRYAVKQFLGEGGRKTVYLAHDSLLDCDVAFALIKTEGLDDVGRERVRREAQAMGRLGRGLGIFSPQRLVLAITCAVA